MNKSYQEFLKSKKIIDPDSGFRINKSELNKQLFDFQKAIVSWSLKKGKAAIFADTGLGKTPMQLDISALWAKLAFFKSKKPILIFAPLAVSKQTKKEGIKFGIEVNICNNQDDIINGINITNYEKLHKFKPNNLGGIVLDESSILKGFDGKFRKDITLFAKDIPYRLACTATPAPNDIMEIINHAEFLGVMNQKEITGLFFIQDGNVTHKWRLKHHAKKDFYKWLTSWAVALRKPSDLGFDDTKFILPKLNQKQVIVKNLIKREGLFLFDNKPLGGLSERRKARKDSLNERIKEAVKLVSNSNEQWLLWCDLNIESEELKKQISNSVQVRGSDSPEYKEKSMINFQNGKIRVLITKPSIAGFGMNWQNCHNMIFAGLSDSFERLYQATRRCWRFGQKKEVNSYIITSEAEGDVLENIKRKEQEMNNMMDNLVKEMNLSGQIKKTERLEMDYELKTVKNKNYTLVLGDSIETIKKIPDNKIGLSIFSPPFPGMYTYTNSKRDLGNTKTIKELIDHFKYLIPELLRITKPGRHCCLHLCQSVAFKNRDGYIGIKDFRGEVIKAMEKEGWVYYGEVCIDKNPQVKAIRTKDRGLLFKTLCTDASHLHAALADYLLQFRKPGENEEPIKAGNAEKYNSNGWITPQEWIEWAAPVWYRQTKDYPGGIKETDVLQFRHAKDKEDEKHLCPLQLGVIERAVKLWSNPGDTIYSPFAGIGSEGYVALKLNRKFIGCELKESYFKVADKNLKSVKSGNERLNLFQVCGG